MGAGLAQCLHRDGGHLPLDVAMIRLRVALVELVQHWTFAPLRCHSADHSGNIFLWRAVIVRIPT